MKPMTMRGIALPAVLATVLMATGCSSLSTKEARDGVAFPDPARASMPEGTFINIENLRKVARGLNKRQLYALLGTPHFNEGVFGVRRWNYIFDFRKTNGDYFSCQYQVAFDAEGSATAFYWKPSSCSSVLDEPVATEASPPVALPAEPIRLSSDALFDFNRSELTEEGRSRLSSLLKQVQSASQIENIVVIGYTDRIGSDGYNQALSRRRAESVRNYLVAGGVPATAIQVEGHGKADPLVQCSGTRRQALIACLAPNRRVELSGAARPGSP